MTEQLLTLKQQNKNLKDQLTALRQKHEYTVIQLSDSKENEEKLKKINDALMKSLEECTVDLEPLKNINLVLQGQFTSQKIAELELELDKYRNGVNASVDRRVRQIVSGLSEMQEVSKASNKSIGDQNNVSISYNVHQHQKANEKCQTCVYLKGLLEEKDKTIGEQNIQIDELRADISILSSKLNKMEALIDTLKKENKLLQKQLTNAQYQLSQAKKNSCYTDRTYFDQMSQDRSKSRISYTKDRAIPSDCKDKENMMREISLIANGFSSRKQYEDRGKSRVVAVKDSNALFSIKNGINRPGQPFF